jgi:hypothetical protein
MMQFFAKYGVEVATFVLVAYFFHRTWFMIKYYNAPDKEKDRIFIKDIHGWLSWSLLLAAIVVILIGRYAKYLAS